MRKMGQAGKAVSRQERMEWLPCLCRTVWVTPGVAVDQAAVDTVGWKLKTSHTTETDQWASEVLGTGDWPMEELKECFLFVCFEIFIILIMCMCVGGVCTRMQMPTEGKGMRSPWSWGYVLLDCCKPRVLRKSTMCLEHWAISPASQRMGFKSVVRIKQEHECGKKKEEHDRVPALSTCWKVNQKSQLLSNSITSVALLVATDSVSCKHRR